MAEIQVGGHAVVWGVPAFTGLAKGTIADPGTAVAVYITEVNYELQHDVEETREADGDVVNLTMYNQREQCSVTCYPYGTTKSNADTANSLPALGNSFGITDSANADAEIGGSSEKVWLVTGASKARTQTGKTVWNLTLQRWSGITGGYAQLS